MVPIPRDITQAGADHAPGTDAAIPPPTQPIAAFTLPRRPLVLALLCVAQFLVALDFSVVNIALPAMQAELGLTPAGIGWVVSAYALTFGGFLLVGGRAADLFGRRRMFMGGLVLFGIASMLGGLARGQLEVIAARAAQGLGAAILLPAALALIGALFADGADRRRALGALGAVGSAGAAAGVVLGGVLTEALSWRWVFFINAPIVVATLAVAPLLVPRRRTPRGTEPLDLRGAALGTGALLLLIFGLERVREEGWTAPTGGGFVVVAVVLLAAFVGVERRACAPVLPLHLLRRRSIAGANVVALAATGTFLPALVVLSQYLQADLGFTALQAGIAFLPMTAVLLLCSGYAAGRLAPLLGLRRLSVIAMAALAGGLAWFTRLPSAGSYAADVLPGLLLVAVGAGTMFTVFLSAATADVDVRQQGAASGMVSSVRQVGAAIGAAVMVTAAAADGYPVTFGLAAAAVAAAGVVGARTLPTREGVRTSPAAGSP